VTSSCRRPLGLTLPAMGPMVWDASNPVTEWRNCVDPIRTNLVQVHAHRQMYREVVKAVEQDMTVSTTWRNHYARLYADAQIMAFRRVVRGYDPNAASLSKLLQSMEQAPKAFDYGLVKAMASDFDSSPDYLERAVEDFERSWGNGSGHLDPEIPGRDRKALSEDADGVIRWANRSIAHIDLRYAVPPTFGDIDKAIDHATEVFQRYGGLLTRNHYDMDVVLDPGWRVPLMRPLFGRPEWLP
jgi:hypothetical protein